jgi:hypothetical protein
VQASREAINALFVANKVPPGQGRRVLGSDPSLETTKGFLENVKDAADRLKVSIVGKGVVNEALLAAVQSNLDAAIVTLTRPQISELVRATDVSGALQDAVQMTASNESTLASLIQYLLDFKRNYEEQISLSNTDLTQAEAISAGAKELSDQIVAAQDSNMDVTSFIQNWGLTLSVLSGISKNTTLTGVRSIFTDSPVISKLYQSLVDSLRGVPSVDITPAVRAADSLGALLRGTDQSAYAQDQKVLLVAQVREGIMGARERALAWINIVDAHPFPTSTLMVNILEMLSRSKFDRPTKALLQGDIAEFFSLGAGDVAATDRVATELRQTIDQNTFSGEQIVSAFSILQDQERHDTSSAQGFEDARDNALAAVQQELDFLARLEVLLDREDIA